MNDPDQLEEQLFDKCLELSPEEWKPFLEQACAGNEALRESVLSLLESHNREGGFLDPVSQQGGAPLELPDRLPAGREENGQRIHSPTYLRWWFWLGGICAAILLVWILLSLSKDRVAPNLAVASFESVVPGAIEPAFISGFQGELLHELSTLQAFAANGSDGDLNRVPKRSGTVLSLTGECQLDRETLRIHAHMIDRFEQRTVWSQSYTRILNEKNGRLVQQDLAAVISKAVRESIGEANADKYSQILSYHPDAVESYHAGMEILESDLKTFMPKAITHFEKAIELDPNFVLAYVGLAETYRNSGGLIYGNLPEDQRRELMKEAAEKAMAMGEDIPEAQVMDGYLKVEVRDRAGALTAFNRALRLDPDCAEAYLGLAELEFQKRIPPADPEFSAFMNRVIDLKHQAIERDPEVPRLYGELGFSLGQLALVEESSRQYQTSVDLNPRFAPGYLGLASNPIYYQGRIDRAMPHLRKALVLDPLKLEYRLDVRNACEAVGDLEAAIEISEQVMNHLEDTVTIFHADYYRLKGDAAKAYECYEQLLLNSREYQVVETARRRLLNADLRNSRFEEGRRRYFSWMISLFHKDPSIDSLGKAIMALELVPFLIGLEAFEPVDGLVDGAWEFLRHLPSKDPQYAFYELLVNYYRGESDAALAVFEQAVAEGFRDLLYLQDARLDPLREEPRFMAAMEIVRQELGEQRAAIDAMEKKGELEPLPQLTF